LNLEDVRSSILLSPLPPWKCGKTNYLFKFFWTLFCFFWWFLTILVEQSKTSHSIFQKHCTSLQTMKMLRNKQGFFFSFLDFSWGFTWVLPLFWLFSDCWLRGS
jgi:hypothetical protein